MFIFERFRSNHFNKGEIDMSSVLIENSPMTYDYSPVLDLDFGSLFKKPNDDEFFDFCQRNKSMRIENGRIRRKRRVFRLAD